MSMGRVATLIAVVLTHAATGSLAAQKLLPPTNVRLRANGASVSVSWTPVEARGVTYRVLRGLDARGGGVDLTKPTETASFEDGQVPAGATYYYQVIAVYGEGGSEPTLPTAITIPAAVIAGPATVPGTSIVGAPIGMAPGGVTSKNPMITPTAVNGVTVTGTTTASATVSWQPVTGATSYGITRSSPGGTSGIVVSGLTGTSYQDKGPGNAGFWGPGTYGFQVTATLAGGTTVSGQASWTRPAPTCAAPLPTQPNLTVLSPTSSSGFTSSGPFPGGPLLDWTISKGTPVVAYRMERSPAGSNAWSLIATSCGGPGFTQSGTATMPSTSWRFVDPTAPLAPGTTYSYRLTAIAASGDYGQGDLSWIQPNPGIIRLLGATVTTTSVTVNWRYESPATNPPAFPSAFKVTTSYGQSKSSYSAPCTSVGGCSVSVPIGPSGLQKFTVLAAWGQNGGSYQANNAAPGVIMGTQSADTTLTIP